jgi:hypothetical protein
MEDRYPSTDEEQYVHLDIAYPDARQDLNRWLPLVKWLLAIPHYIVLIFLWIGAVVAVVVAWFAILFSGRYPRGLFDYVEGVIRWASDCLRRHPDYRSVPAVSAASIRGHEASRAHGRLGP